MLVFLHGSTPAFHRYPLRGVASELQGMGKLLLYTIAQKRKELSSAVSDASLDPAVVG